MEGWFQPEADIRQSGARRAVVFCWEMVRDDLLTIYVDGSSHANPRRGGIGIRVVTINAHGEEEIEDIPCMGFQAATNNQMELMACIEALRVASNHPLAAQAGRVRIVSDSRYVTENYRKSLAIWPSQKWRDRHGRPLENVELWKELAKAIRKAGIKIDIEWEPGKSSPNTKAVDKLAKASAKAAWLNQPLRTVAVRKKLSSRSVERGSVPMRGQELDIRIITDTLLRSHRVYRYKYEVLPSSRELVGCVDIADSEHLMKAGHHYRVRLGTVAENPAIPEVLAELERIRLARKSDIQAMHEVRMAVKQNQLTSRTLTEADYRNAIRRPGRGWVVDFEGRIVGFGTANAETGNVWALFVHPDFERRGFGRLLHQAMTAWLWSEGAPKAWLTTGPSTRASGFYRAAGWTFVGLNDAGEERYELLRPA